MRGLWWGGLTLRTLSSLSVTFCGIRATTGMESSGVWCVWRADGTCCAAWCVSLYRMADYGLRFVFAGRGCGVFSIAIERGRRPRRVRVA